MQRNLDLHHATETLEGFSDFHLLAAKRHHDVFRKGDVAIAAVGTSIPVGKTEDDPYALGDAGLPHEHIQFGSGTLDPLLELYYIAPVSEDFRLALSGIGRFPLYENRKGYQGPVEVSANATVAYGLTEKLSLHAGWSSFYQGYAHWDGDRDINSGLISHGVTAGGSYVLRGGATMTFSVRVPLSQDTLSDDGDTFEQGAIAQLGVSYSF